LTGVRSAAYGRLVLDDAGIKINRGGEDEHRKLDTLEDVQLEQAIEALRRARVETKRAEEEVKEYGFRRTMLVVVLSILALVALGSLAIVAAGISAGQYPLAAGAIAPLSGSGAMSVLAWRAYIRNALCRGMDDRAQAGGSFETAAKLG
jgi:hypothetical protein